MAGYDQRYVPTKSVPLSIVLESTQAVAGDLEISSLAPDGSALVRSLPVEVPAGGRKQFDLVIPGAGVPSPRLQIAVRESNEILASTQLELLAAGNQLLVGFLTADLPGGVAGTRIEPTGHELRSVRVPEAWLALGSKALQPLAYLVLDSDAARALPKGHQQTVFEWVICGGRLVVTTPDPSALDWLPEAWRSSWSREGSRWVPSAGGPGRVVSEGTLSTTAGLGRVLVTPNAGPGDLGGVIAALTPAPSTTTNRRELFGGPSIDFELLSALSSKSGGAIRLSWLVVFLVLYVLIAGPLNYLILRRSGRKELAWITIPLLALIFSAVAYGLARSARGGLEVQQASVVFATSEGQVSHRLVTVSSGAGGRHTVEFDSRDALEPWGAEGFQPFGNRTAVRRKLVRLTGSGSEAIVETTPFSSGITQGSISTSVGFLDADLAWDGTAILGKVTNRTSLKLNVQMVRPGSRDVVVGELDPGASKEVRVETSEPVGPPIRFDPFFATEGRGSDEHLRRSLTNTLHSMLGPEHVFGASFVIGYSDDFAPGLKVDGSKASPAGPTIIVSPLEVSVPPDSTGSIPAIAGQMEMLSVDGNAFFSGYALQLQDYREAIFSYRLPAGVTASQVKEASLNKGFGGAGFKVEVFDWEQKRWVEPPSAGSNRDTLPAGAFSGFGEAYLRITPQNEPFVELWGLSVGVNLG